MNDKIIYIRNEDYPEFYITVRHLYPDQMVISIYDSQGNLKVETAVKEQLPHKW